MAKEAKEKPIFNIHSSKKQLEQLIKTCYEHHTKIDIEREGIKAAKTTAKEMGVDPKKFVTILNMYIKQNRDEVEQEKDEAIDLFDELFNKGFTPVDTSITLADVIGEDS